MDEVEKRLLKVFTNEASKEEIEKIKQRAHEFFKRVLIKNSLKKIK